MAKAYPRQERKRHSVTWRGLTDEVIPKRRALLLCSAVLLIPTHLPFPLGGFVGFFFFLPVLGIKPRVLHNRKVLYY